MFEDEWSGDRVGECVPPVKMPVDPRLMLRVARGFRSNCCGGLWAVYGTTATRLPFQQACPRCASGAFSDGRTPFMTARQWRLLACAITRLFWHHGSVHSWRLVEAVERYADGCTPYGEVWGMIPNPYTYVGRTRDFAGYMDDVDWFSFCALVAMDEEWQQALGRRISHHANSASLWMGFSELIRDAVPNPWRYTVTPGDPFPTPSWRTDAVAAVAEAAYNSGSSGRFPCIPDVQQDCLVSRLDARILAALADEAEYAGCTDDILLAHLRSGGTHMKCCWAVNMASGRAAWSPPCLKPNVVGVEQISVPVRPLRRSAHI